MIPSGPSRDYAPQLQEVAEALDREWRRARLGQADRQVLVDEVMADLAAAADDGVDPGLLIGPDPAAFARETAEARGFVAEPAGLGLIYLGALVGAVAALAVGLVLASSMRAVLMGWVTLETRHPVAGIRLFYGGLFVTSFLGAGCGLAVVLRGRPAARAMLIRAALFLPTAAVAGIALAMRFGRLTDYSDLVGVIVVEIAIVLAACAAALAAARQLALHALHSSERRG